MEPTDAVISVVVLSYNRPHYLSRSLDALAAQTYSAAHLEIIVVDNRSDASDEIARIVGLHSRARLIANPTNLGFTGGMNVGLRAASGDFVYLIEDDILLAPENVTELAKYAASHPNAGIVSGLMLDEGSGRIWFAGGHLTLDPFFRIDLPGQGDADAGQFTRPFAVSYLSGATMFARRDLWERLGGFREDFFMYNEDVELGLRVLASGQDLVIVPSARSRHFTPPRATGDRLAFHRCKNLLLLYTLHAPARLLPLFLLRYGFMCARRGVIERAPVVPAWAYYARHLPELLGARKHNEATRDSAWRRVEQCRRSAGVGP